MTEEYSDVLDNSVRKSEISSHQKFLEWASSYKLLCELYQSENDESERRLIFQRISSCLEQGKKFFQSSVSSMAKFRSDFIPISGKNSTATSVYSSSQPVDSRPALKIKALVYKKESLSSQSYLPSRTYLINNVKKLSTSE